MIVVLDALERRHIGVVTIQAVIQERRPEYSITVSRWPGRWENIVVYYRPKVGRYLSDVEKAS